MSLLMFTIYDRVGATYSDIKLFNNEALAVRWFKNFKNESKFGDDLDLYYLGKYDLSTAEISAIKPDLTEVF